MPPRHAMPRSFPDPPMPCTRHTGHMIFLAPHARALAQSFWAAGIVLGMIMQAARYQVVVMLLVAASSGMGSTAAVLLAVNSIVDQQHRVRRERLVPRAPGSAGVANWMQAQAAKVGALPPTEMACLFSRAPLFLLSAVMRHLMSSWNRTCDRNIEIVAGALVSSETSSVGVVQGWAAARNQARRLMMRVRLSYRQRATWQGRRRSTWLRGSGLARRVFGSQMEASTMPVLLTICSCHW